MRLATLLLVSTAAFQAAMAQQTNPPQRTITRQPSENAVPVDVKPSSPGTPSNASSAVDQYRAMWQKMTPAQQKAIVSAGGPTPEQYERMMMRAIGGKGPSAGASTSPSSDAGRTADPGALDALSKSLQDLNAVRDGNLSLVQKDGCAPELASRIADLKAKLRSDEFELNGTEAPAPAVPSDVRATEKANAADPLAVATDWFKKPAEAKLTRTDDAMRTRESNQLDAVLSGTQAVTPGERRFDPKSPDAEQNRKAVEADMARVKAELEQLSSACAAAKR